MNNLNKNLVFATQFIKEIADSLSEGFKRNWSSEKEVHYTSRLGELFDLGVEKDFIMVIDSRFVRDFSAKEKLFIYEVLRLAGIYHSELRWLAGDLQFLLDKRGYYNERYFYLCSLTDSEFAYEMDCQLTPNTQSRRKYYRKLSSTFGKKQLSYLEVAEKYFFTDIIELNRRRAKKAQRIKGYRDHGSLGSEFSRTLKQQSCDFSIVGPVEQRRKFIEDLKEFLLGFGGWK